MKKKKGMLTDDKTRIGYQDAGEVKRQTINYERNKETDVFETKAAAIENKRLNAELQNIIDEENKLADNANMYDQDLLTKTQLKLAMRKEEIKRDLANVAGTIDPNRETKYSGGMLSDDKDRMSYAEGKEVETHMMPDGTEMAGATHGEYEEEMAMPTEEMPMPAEEMDMVSDEQMEQDHLDFIINESLDQEEESYLMQALQADDRLSMIFDKVMDTASEFSGDGPVEGLGSEVSDSIPARLSDGEFVITAKATDEIGSDNLQNMMDSAEEVSDDRKQVAMGGSIQDESKVDQFGKSIDEDLVDEEIRRSMLSVNPRLQ
jgi:hypothetical protein